MPGVQDPFHRRPHLADIADDLSIVASLESNSTESDLAGPGRVMGHILSAGGRRLDRIVGRLVHKPHSPNPGNTLADASSVFDIQADDLLDDFTFVTDSLDTTSDAVGLGNTLGKVLSIGGERLNRLLGKTMSRLGFGADPSIKRVAELLEAQMKATILQRRCGTCMTFWSASPRTSAISPLQMLLDYVGDFRHLGCLTCRGEAVPKLLSQREFRKLCSGIVRRTRQSHPYTRMSTTYCIFALASFHDSMRAYLEGIGAIEALESTRRDLTLRLKHHEPLLTSSRRALVWFAQNDVLTVLKTCLGIANVSSSTTRLRKYNLQGALENLDSGITQLITVMRHPDHQVTAIAGLTQLLGHYFDFLIHINHHARPVVLSEGFVSLLWYLLASTADPVLEGLVVTLLLTVYHEYATYSIERKSFHRMLSQERVDSAIWNVWVWSSLSMPLFRTRVSMPQVLQKLRPSDLEALMFDMQTPYGQGSGPHLQPSMRAGIRSLKGVMASFLSDHDPVLQLIMDLTCPLNELADDFQKARFFAWEIKGYEIPRAIPEQELSIVRRQVVEGTLECTCTADDVAMYLNKIAPHYERELQNWLLHELGSLSWFKAAKHVLMEEWYNYVPPESPFELSFTCTGIFQYVDITGSTKVINRHWNSSIPSERHSCSRLVTPDTTAHMRWVPMEELSEAYFPIRIVGMVGKEPERFIQCRNPGLITLGDSQTSGTGETVYCLALTTYDAPVFWMSSSYLIHAIKGDEFELLHKDAETECSCQADWNHYWFTEEDD